MTRAARLVRVVAGIGGAIEWRWQDEAGADRGLALSPAAALGWAGGLIRRARGGGLVFWTWTAGDAEWRGQLARVNALQLAEDLVSGARRRLEGAA